MAVEDGARVRKKLNLSKLHVACSEGTADEVRALLAQAQALGSKKAQRLSREIMILGTPNIDDSYLMAHLPIHTACQRREDSGRIIEALLTEGGYSILDKTVNGDTALHVACTSSNLEAVQTLLASSEQSSIRECLRHQNKEGNTPLHLASRSRTPEITSLLLEHLLPVDCKQVLSKANKLGQTCVGLAVGSGDWSSVKLLLKRSRGNPALLYQDFARLFPEARLTDDLQALEHEPLDVFLLGDSESGKSTLIGTFHHAALSTLNKLANTISLWGTGGRPIAEPFKTGIVPLTVEYRRQDHKCPLTFHDVGGHRDYAQEAIFTCSRNPLQAMYVITVDARRNVEEAVLYWLSFLANRLAEYRRCVLQSPLRAGRMKPKVVIAVTFCDIVSSSRLQAVSKVVDWSYLAVSNENLAGQFTWCGNYYLNARKHSSWNAPQLLAKLQEQCRFSSERAEEEQAESLLAQTYLMASLLLKEYSRTSVTNFGDVIGFVQRTSNPLCKLLPSQDEEIEKLCHNLRFFGNSFKLLTFDPPTKKEMMWYIVFDYKYLLRAVKEGLSQLSPLAINGIVTRQQIKSVFNYRLKFMVPFLEHLKLCEYVNRTGLQSMRDSIRFSRRSSISSHKSTLDLPDIVVQSNTDLSHLKNRYPRRHRRTKSDSHTINSSDVMTDRGLSASTDKMASGNGDTACLSPDSLLDVFPSPSLTPSGSRHSSKTPSPASSRQSSRRSNASHYRKEVPHYFFPSLVRKQQPKELWDEDASGGYTYGFAWSLVPPDGEGGESWFLSPKFVTIVLFRLLFSFAPHPANPRSFVDRMCTLWDRGILWSDPLGARVCLAVSEDSKVTLSMQCLRGYEVPCLSIRNEIMADVRLQLREIHPGLCPPRELFTPYDGISPFPVLDHAPHSSYNTFDKEEIRRAIAEKRPAMCTRGRHHKPVQSLLYFEPLCYLSPPLLRCLLDQRNDLLQISDDFCLSLAKNLSSEWRHLADHFMDTVIRKYQVDSLNGEDQAQRRAPHDTAMEMLLYLRQVDYKDEAERVDTYAGLRKSLFEISIFTPEEIGEHVMS